MHKDTLALIARLVEIVAMVRSGIATYAVTLYVSGGDTLYAIFTVGVVEFVFLSSLHMIGLEAVAPISAILALLFAVATQYYELKLGQSPTHSLPQGDVDMLTWVIAFAPMAVLLMAFLRQMTMKEKSGSAIGGLVTFRRQLASLWGGIWGGEMPKTPRIPAPDRVADNVPN